MPLTPETLTRHELNGLHVAVTEAANPDLVGIAGRVVSETTNTLVVRTRSGDKRVPKAGSTLEFRLSRTDEAAAAGKAAGTASELRADTAGTDAGQSGRCEGAAYVTVDGARLLSRPALRTEDAGDTIWR
jgi:ribonuclease P protein subunit POP4